MPSSMIFAGLVVIWLLILVPAVARHRQEVARPSSAALAGRVLERPGQRQNMEVDAMDEVEQPRMAATRSDRDDIEEPGLPEGADRDGRHEGDDDRSWERPPPRYRPGRGGFDPEAAALTARARYAHRQRIVLGMLITALGAAVVALIAVPGVWWLHGVVDVALVGYLIYLRRQVRLEEAIRERRAARMAGTHRPSAAEDPELDEWARRGREATARPTTDDDGLDDLDEDATLDEDDLQREDPERVTGTGAPIHVDEDYDEDDEEPAEPALPRLQPAPPPPLPAGTALVDADTEDPDLYDLDGPARPDYRRAAGE